MLWFCSLKTVRKERVTRRSKHTILITLVCIFKQRLQASSSINLSQLKQEGHDALHCSPKLLGTARLSGSQL